MNLHIRPFTLDDVDPIIDLSLLAFAPIFQSFEHVLGKSLFLRIYPDWKTSQQTGIEGLIRDMAKNTTLVAEVDGAVVGFLGYDLNLEEKTAEVQILAVHPAFQNQEIGTELNRVALEQIRERGITLAVVGTGGDPAHAPARRCYEKAGYTGLPLVRYYQEVSPQ
jgi:ribosomal protein S18 acetylase RimI-like enzyme